jgi:hypothetical protein
LSFDFFKIHNPLLIPVHYPDKRRAMQTETTNSPFFFAVCLPPSRERPDQAGLGSKCDKTPPKSSRWQNSTENGYEKRQFQFQYRGEAKTTRKKYAGNHPKTPLAALGF